MDRIAVILCLSVLALFSSGFVSTRTSTGAAVAWSRGSRLVFRTNASTISSLRADQIFNIFTTSLNRWKQAAEAGFDFTYYQGTNTAIYPNYLNSTADNSIFFTSNALNANEKLPCGLVAVTQVWFNSGSGQASKADLRFNDNCFEFTNNSGDTVSQSRIYLGDVATHEIGHALGLDHSQNLQSSMVYTAAIQEAEPSCDDLTAMKSVYGDASKAATINGRVVSEDGASVFGAFVEAVSVDRGVVLGSALTDRDGSYSIKGLEQGSYRLVASPFYPGSGSLSRYYAGINPRVCGGGQALFNRSFLPSTISVNAGQTASANPLVGSCNAVSSAYGGQERTPSTAPILSQSGLLTPLSVINTFSSNGSIHYYSVKSAQGTVQIHGLAYSLYSPADVSLEVYNTLGQRLSGQQTFADVFSAPSGYINYDASAQIVLNQPTDLIIAITNRGSPAISAYPSGSLGLDNNAFYLLTVSTPPSPTVVLYPQNARCEQTDTFSSYPNQGDPSSLPGRPGTTPSVPSGGCGTIEKSGTPQEQAYQERIRALNFSIIAFSLAMMHLYLRRRPYFR